MIGKKHYVSASEPTRTELTEGCQPQSLQCETECLVQPRFFCGQLLTDQDLNALLEWAKGKHRLDRHSDGWGVTQGLQVQCAADQSCHLVVNPGSAIDPCGNDILVCAPAMLDLSEVCRAPSTPCDVFGSDQSDYQESDQADLELRAVDITIQYAEHPELPVPALPVGTCNTGTACEMSRTQEGFALSWQEVACESDPLSEAAERWSLEYRRCLEVIQCLHNDIPYLEGRGADIKAWLLAWLERNPLQQFCFLAWELAQRDADHFENPADLSETLFWIVQDCRNRFLAQPYAWYPAGNAVPLARVWLGRQTDSRGDWWPLYIDNKPPYRRRLGLERLPAPLGYTNLAELVWCRYDDACSRLRDWNIRFVDDVWEELPQSPAELLERLDCDPIVPCGQEIGLEVLRRQGAAQKILGDRVIGFCGPLQVLPTPTTQPTPQTTVTPTRPPTAKPTEQPTPEPTSRPTVEPTQRPTIKPTPGPTIRPTITPTIRPTLGPTIRPTITPTIRPTIEPTFRPTITPTLRPTIGPTFRPILEPTLEPGISPTLRPGLVDAPVFRPEDFPDRLVTEVTGIGDVSARRLAEKKIENLASLASMRPTELAETLEISEVRAMTFIDEAKTKLIQPKE